MSNKLLLALISVGFAGAVANPAEAGDVRRVVGVRRASSRAVAPPRPGVTRIARVRAVSPTMRTWRVSPPAIGEWDLHGDLEQDVEPEVIEVVVPASDPQAVVPAAAAPEFSEATSRTAERIVRAPDYGTVAYLARQAAALDRLKARAVASIRQAPWPDRP